VCVCVCVWWRCACVCACVWWWWCGVWYVCARVRVQAVILVVNPQQQMGGNVLSKWRCARPSHGGVIPLCQSPTLLSGFYDIAYISTGVAYISTRVAYISTRVAYISTRVCQSCMPSSTAVKWRCHHLEALCHHLPRLSGVMASICYVDPLR
jgi:hypothetical protein